MLLGLLLFPLGKGLLWGSHPMERVAPMLYSWLTFCALGLVTAGIAMLRAERLWGVTAVGFVLSALPLIVCACITINHIWWGIDFQSYTTDFGAGDYSPSLIAEVRSSILQ